MVDYSFAVVSQRLHEENGRKTSHYITTGIPYHALLRLNYHTNNTILLTFQFIEFQHLTPMT